MAHVLDLDKIEGLKRNGSDFVGRCPVCALESRDRSKNHLSILSSGVYNCIADSEHNKGIYQLIGVGSSGIIEGRPIEQPRIECIKTWDIGLLSKLVQDFGYFEGRGISAETQKKFGMGVALTGQLNHRVCCPILSEDGLRILGFSARSFIGKEPRWKILGPKKSFVYPAWINKQIIEKEREVILVEGIGCVLSLWENGIKNSICLFGTNLSSKIIAFLIKVNPSRIIISLNNEPSGIGLSASEKARDTLKNFFSEDRIKIFLPLKKDFGDMSKEEISRWFHSIRE